MATGSIKQQLRQALVWKPLKAFRGTIGLMVLSLILLAISQAALLALIGPFVSSFFGAPLPVKIPANLDQASPLIKDILHAKEWFASYVQETVWFLPLLVILVGGLKSLAGYSFNLAQTVLALKWSDLVRRLLFQSIAEQPWLDSSRKSPAHWMSVLMNDVAFLQNRISDVITAFARDGIACAASFVWVLYMHWPSGLALIALSPFLAYGFGRASQRIAWYAKFWQLELAKLSSIVLDIRERFAMIFSQGGQGSEVRRFRLSIERYYETMRRSILLRSALAPGMEWLGFLFLAVLYIYTGRKQWGADFAPVYMFQVFTAVAIMFKPLRNLGEQLTTYAELRGALRPSLELLQKLMALPAGQQGHFHSRVNSLEIEELRAGYGLGRQEIVAHGLSLHAGQCIAIVGPSGAGKSTLMRVFSGLLPPEKWLSKVPWLDIGRSSTLVSQNPFVFAGTIRDNLLFAWPSKQQPSDEDIWKALEAVRLKELVQGLNGGLAATLSALQRNLSGGQIQRLLIARALLRPEPIIVCDEVTAALDAGLEFAITETLCAHARASGRILLFITHRLGQLHLFDTQWQVEAGGVRQILGTVHK